MTERREQYRWCGYARAVAGDQRSKDGLKLAVFGRIQQEIKDEEVMDQYRKYLFEKGFARGAGNDGTPARKGFTQEDVDKVVNSGGKLGASKQASARCATSPMGWFWEAGNL